MDTKPKITMNPLKMAMAMEKGSSSPGMTSTPMVLVCLRKKPNKENMYNTGKIEGIKGLPRLEALEVEESEEDRYVF